MKKLLTGILKWVNDSFLHCVVGIESFEGKVFHSWDYKRPEELDGKRIVVIGIGNSGGDIAVEASRVAEQVKISDKKETFHETMQAV